jgi:hypothetical protein
MKRKMLALITAVTAALALMSVAVASIDDGSAVTTDPSFAASPTPTIDDTSVSSLAGIENPTTSTSLAEEDDEKTSTTLDDHTDRGDSSTSTTIDDHSDRNTEEHETQSMLFDDQRAEYQIPGVGLVIVEMVGGRLELVSVSAPGWDIEIDDADADEVEVRFRKGSTEVEFEAELDQGKIKIEVESESS